MNHCTLLVQDSFTLLSGMQICIWDVVFLKQKNGAEENLWNHKLHHLEVITSYIQLLSTFLQVESVAVSPEDTAKVTAERPQWRSAARQLVASIHLVSAWQWSWQMDANGYSETTKSSLARLFSDSPMETQDSICHLFVISSGSAHSNRTRH